MSRQKQGVKAQTIQGITLNANELVTKTKIMLRKILASPVQERSCVSSDALSYEFFAAESPYEGDGVGTRLLPLALRGGRDDLWFSVRFELNRSGAQLWHAQVRFVVGSAVEPEKTCFLRLEWDPRVSAERHAQPHWQFEGVAPQREPESFQEYSRETRELRLHEPAAPARPTRDYWYGVEKMHLPMAATFQREGGAPGLLPGVGTTDDLVRWLYGSLAYMRDQFQYVIERRIVAGDS